MADEATLPRREWGGAGIMRRREGGGERRRRNALESMRGASGDSEAGADPAYFQRGGTGGTNTHFGGAAQNFGVLKMLFLGARDNRAPKLSGH